MDINLRDCLICEYKKTEVIRRRKINAFYDAEIYVRLGETYKTRRTKRIFQKERMENNRCHFFLLPCS